MKDESTMTSRLRRSLSATGIVVGVAMAILMVPILLQSIIEERWFGE